ncbi:hypothetical protein Cgig2_019822 [Carnegiea gigantea]|uniref:Uncharacterized protein n=1 Tax=Carnegiea gigantea TaxID=171969 RepID=A0A9Q1JZH8_9CARY|nr:hypothetical protein Cgig2_019822 [Carnegiea gigantea]
MELVANRMVRHWNWENNFDMGGNGRILLAWKPSHYSLTILDKTDQMIHNQATRLSNNSTFFITVRQSLWDDLVQLPKGITDATWCILEDFNAILTSADRIVGIMVLDTEVRDFAAYIDTCELSEVRYVGPYNSWTNKTIWSQLDRVLINHDWHGTFDYTQAEYKTNGCLIILLCSLAFQTDLNAQQGIAIERLNHIQQQFYADPSSYELIKQEANCRAYYINILFSTLSLIKQQCKADYINLGMTALGFSLLKQNKENLPLISTPSMIIHDLPLRDLRQ